MALSIAATNTYTNTTGATSHAVNLPASIAAGDLLLVFAAFNSTPTVTDPAGWDVLVSKVNTDTFRIYARIADGSEGATVTVGISSSERASAVSYRITGNRNGVTSSEIAVSTAVDASTATPDPPNLTPSWGSDENLWIAVTFAASSSFTFSSYPTNYGLSQLNAQAGSNANANAVSIAARLLTATSEDPGTFSTVTARDRSTYTLAVRPAAGVATDPFKLPALPETWSRQRDPTGHLKSLSLTLLGQDQFFGAPGQGPRYDYPNPRAPLRSVDLGNWINTQVPPVVTFPAVSTFTAYSQSTRPITQTWLNTFIPPAASPIVPVIWSSPARSGQAPQFWALNLQETTLAPAAAVPFRWQEWRAPGPKARGESSWAVNLLLTTLATVTPPVVVGGAVRGRVTAISAKATVGAITPKSSVTAISSRSKGSVQ